jgi:hypothetical protein
VPAANSAFAVARRVIQERATTGEHESH